MGHTLPETHGKSDRHSVPSVKAESSSVGHTCLSHRTLQIHNCRTFISLPGFLLKCLFPIRLTFHRKLVGLPAGKAVCCPAGAAEDTPACAYHLWSNAHPHQAQAIGAPFHSASSVPGLGCCHSLCFAFRLAITAVLPVLGAGLSADPIPAASREPRTQINALSLDHCLHSIRPASSQPSHRP